MNEKHIKGSANQVSGKVKEEVGHVTGKEKLAGKGIAQQVVGTAQRVAGNVKDAVKNVVDAALSRTNRAA